MVEHLLTIEEVAAILNVKKSKLRSMIFRREIPYRKVGRLVRFRRREVELWLDNLEGPMACSSTSVVDTKDTFIENSSPIGKALKKD